MSKRKNVYNKENLPTKCFKRSASGVIPSTFLKICDDINDGLSMVQFSKEVAYIYNPTVYAAKGFRKYVETYCSDKKKVLFLGMNPGPWGMSQTGVPFGDVKSVKTWLRIEEEVSKPKQEHPSRPVEGFLCRKTEVSGKRFWGLMKELCGEAAIFFKHCFIYNYLPLQFITKTGKNLPPSALKEQEIIFKVCDKALKEVAILYKVEIVVAIGKFAEARAKAALKDLDIKVVCILHPSPQSKAANNWHVDARKQLEELGIMQYLLPSI